MATISWSLLALLLIGCCFARAAATTLVITDVSRRSVQVLSASVNHGKPVGGSIRLSRSLGKVCCTAVAGDYAFTAGSSSTRTSVAVLRTSGKPKVVKTFRLPGLEKGFFEGCELSGEDIAAKRHSAGFDLYVVIGCRQPLMKRPAANYVAMFRYITSSGQISGPSEAQRWYVNKYENNRFVSIVNSLAVFGGGSSGTGTVYAVLTTTSTSNGRTYKPALHVMKGGRAVPLGILATPPQLPNGIEPPAFSISSPSSFYSIFQQRCPGGSSRCSARQVVTLTARGSGTRQVGRTVTGGPFSPSDLAVSLQSGVLYRLYGRGQQAIVLARSTSAPANGGFQQTAGLSYRSRNPTTADARLQIAAL